MNRTWGIGTTVVLAGWLAGTVAAAHDHEGAGAKPAKASTVTGEVIDVACYVMDGKSATGEDHKACATKCITAGIPVGLLTAKGEVLLAITADHASAKDLLLPFIARRVTVTGTVKKRAGVQLIEVATVVPADAKPAAAAAAPAAKEKWVCPMGCSSSDHAGRCTACGMDLVKAKE